ncbi:MAG: hypothetical protein F6K31_33905 [Symploca sp. SIO2G7]|nr:hypothetical protein [Symploca sp. SIO2G7]
MLSLHSLFSYSSPFPCLSRACLYSSKIICLYTLRSQHYCLTKRSLRIN